MAAAGLIFIAGLASCTATANAGAASAGDAPTVVDQPSEGWGATGATDEDTCRLFSDVMTIVRNAEVGVIEGRMEEQEQQGWQRLATRVLDRIPTTGSGDVSDALAAAKAAAPAVPLAAYGPPTIESEEWQDAASSVITACNDAGFEFGVEMFTGG